MKKSQSRHKRNQREFKRRRKTLSGFPWEGRFQTREEVEAYFAGEKIQCLLCGKWFKQISSSHLERVHETTADAYRQRYQLPWGRGLTGRATHQKISNTTKQRHVKGQLVGFNKQPHLKKSWPVDFPERKARPRQKFLSYRQWRRKDYEAVLSRVQEQQRSLSDVCQDPDLPCDDLWRRYVAQHPEFVKRLKQIYASWPYVVQARVLSELSPQFRVDCQRLWDQGMTYKKIATTLGVHKDAVLRALGRRGKPTDASKAHD